MMLGGLAGAGVGLVGGALLADALHPNMYDEQVNVFNDGGYNDGSYNNDGYNDGSYNDGGFNGGF